MSLAPKTMSRLKISGAHKYMQLTGDSTYTDPPPQPGMLVPPPPPVPTLIVPPPTTTTLISRGSPIGQFQQLLSLRLSDGSFHSCTIMQHLQTDDNDDPEIKNTIFRVKEIRLLLHESSRLKHTRKRKGEERKRKGGEERTINK